jgi:endonuclease/exonuclease/phosphatase (EEP) superfamily protein YafD
MSVSPNDSDADPPKTESLFSSFVTVVSWFAIGVLLFALCGRWFHLAELMGNFLLQLGLAGVFWVLLLAIRRRPKSAMALGAVTLWILHYPLATYLPSGAMSELPHHEIRMMSFNMLTSNRNTELILSRIEEADPDVLILIEYPIGSVQLTARLREKFPYRVEEPRYTGFGIGLFSKLPIEKSEVIYPTTTPEDVRDKRNERDDPWIDAELMVDEARIRVIGVHCFNPIIPSMLSPRNRQMRLLGERVAQNGDLPIVVAGDFNCVPWSCFFHNMLRLSKLRDSRKGFGYQGTWPDGSDLLSIPIDHVLVSDRVQVRSRKILPGADSDHFPVICDLAF